MSDRQRNSIEFSVWGRYAMFTDPLTKIGGEKCSYQVPTYEALKGVAKSIYWKPTFIWVVDEVRVMKRIRTQTKGTKPLNFNEAYPTLAIYTFLAGDPDPVTGEPGVEYQVRAHFEWNEHRPELANDRIEGKHYEITRRMLERGGRQDIFLGTRDCQGYVKPCEFGSGPGHYDNSRDLAFGLVFHGFDYPDETGEDKLCTRFWMPKMIDGVIHFIRPEECPVRKFVHEMKPKQFESGQTLKSVETEMAELEAQA
jgi:CRISPR-associated protein Cas5d